MTEKENKQDWAIEDGWSEKKRRQHKRYNTRFCLRVFDEENLLGDVIDISLGGLKLLGSEILPLGQIMSLRLEAVLESGQPASFEFQAGVAWSDQDENPGRYITGLEFLGLLAQGREIMQGMINQWTQSSGSVSVCKLTPIK